MNQLVIDTDPGVDDARAILLASAYPDTHIRAITTVAGNVGVEKTTANACTLLDLLGADPAETALYRGAATGILATKYDGSYFHGEDGFGNNHFPRSARCVESEHAVNALVRLANEHPGEYTLAAIGPLTNLALATRLDPDLPRKYKRLVVMGGTIRGMGNNRYNPSAEFNAYMDPEAVAIVFETWRDLWLVSWETTLQYPLFGTELDALMNVNTPRGEFWAQISRASVDYVARRFGQPRIFLPDEIALAIAVEPSIVTRSEKHSMTAELRGEHTRGQTTVDWTDHTGREPNVNIVLEINRDRLMELLMASME